MNRASIVKFADMKQSPEVRMDLPEPIPLGSKIKLAFILSRVHRGRTEELKVNGDFQVTSVITDLTRGTTKQIVIVSSTGLAPAWVAIKSTPKKIAPTHCGPTKVL